jgi:hypothetical protein
MSLEAMVFLICISGHQCDDAARAYAAVPRVRQNLRRAKETAIDYLGPYTVEALPVAVALSDDRFSARLWGPIRFTASDSQYMLIYKRSF